MAYTPQDLQKYGIKLYRTSPNGPISVYESGGFGQVSGTGRTGTLNANELGSGYNIIDLGDNPLENASKYGMNLSTSKGNMFGSGSTGLEALLGAYRQNESALTPLTPEQQATQAPIKPPEGMTQWQYNMQQNQPQPQNATYTAPTPTPQVGAYTSTATQANVPPNLSTGKFDAGWKPTVAGEVAPFSGQTAGSPTTQPQNGRLLRPSEFTNLTKQGLTENDIIRIGQDIYLKPNSRFTVGGTGEGITSTTSQTASSPLESATGTTPPSATAALPGSLQEAFQSMESSSVPTQQEIDLQNKLIELQNQLSPYSKTMADIQKGSTLSPFAEGAEGIRAGQIQNEMQTLSSQLANLQAQREAKLQQSQAIFQALSPQAVAGIPFQFNPQTGQMEPISGAMSPTIAKGAVTTLLGQGLSLAEIDQLQPGLLESAGIGAGVAGVATQSKQDLANIQSLASKYPQAGITSSDSLETATAKAAPFAQATLEKSLQPTTSTYTTPSGITGFYTSKPGVAAPTAITPPVSQTQQSPSAAARTAVSTSVSSQSSGLSQGQIQQLNQAALRGRPEDIKNVQFAMQKYGYKPPVGSKVPAPTTPKPTTPAKKGPVAQKTGVSPSPSVSKVASTGGSSLSSLSEGAKGIYHQLENNAAPSVLSKNHEKTPQDKADYAAALRAFEKDHPDFSEANSELGYYSQKRQVAGLTNSAITQRRASINAATNQLDSIVLPLSDKFERGGVKTINKAWLKSQLELNNPDAVKFQTAVNTVVEELGKAFGGSAGLTDAKLAFAESLLDKNYSPEAFKAQIQTMESILRSSDSEYQKMLNAATGTTTTSDPLGIR